MFVVFCTRSPSPSVGQSLGYTCGALKWLVKMLRAFQTIKPPACGHCAATLCRVFISAADMVSFTLAVSLCSLIIMLVTLCQLVSKVSLGANEFVKLNAVLKSPPFKAAVARAMVLACS